MESFLFHSGRWYTSQKKYTQARNSFRIASDMNHAASMRELAVLYIRGQGGNVVLSEGMRLLRQAEARGDADAALILDSFLEI